MRMLAVTMAVQLFWQCGGLMDDPLATREKPSGPHTSTTHTHLVLDVFVVTMSVNTFRAMTKGSMLGCSNLMNTRQFMFWACKHQAPAQDRGEG